MKQDDTICYARYKGYVCNLQPGHTGPHEAFRYIDGSLLNTWPNIPKPPEPVSDEDVRAVLVEAMASHWAGERNWTMYDANTKRGYMRTAGTMLDGLINKMKEIADS